MKWVCPDCGFGGPIKTQRPVTISGEYTLNTLGENRCRSCDDGVKTGVVVGDCPNHGGSVGSRYVEYFEEDPRFHYCTKCDMHLYYEQPEDNDYPLDAAPYCPVCHELKEKQDLDFHHWDYDTDKGIHVCRKCHEKIHGGMTAKEQGQEADAGVSWKTVALANLIILHKNSHGDIHTLADFRKRYNLPLRGEFDDRAIGWMDEESLSTV